MFHFDCLYVLLLSIELSLFVAVSVYDGPRVIFVRMPNEAGITFYVMQPEPFHFFRLCFAVPLFSVAALCLFFSIVF